MRIRTARDIGILIKEARNRRGLSQAALAKLMNTTQTWVSWIENGKPTAEIGSVLLALTTLGVEMNFSPPPVPSSDGAADQHRDDAADHDRGGAEQERDDDDTPPYKL